MWLVLELKAAGVKFNETSTSLEKHTRLTDFVRRSDQDENNVVNSRIPASLRFIVIVGTCQWRRDTKAAFKSLSIS
jgi:hypothetical protein